MIERKGKKGRERDLRGNWEAVCPTSSPPVNICQDRRASQPNDEIIVFRALKNNVFYGFTVYPSHVEQVCTYVFVLVGWLVFQFCRKRQGQDE